MTPARAPSGSRDPSALWVVIPTFTAGERLGACLRSLAEQDEPHRVLVVDDGGGRAADVLRAFPEVLLTPLPRNLGFAGAANRGLRRALLLGAAWILLLNDDTTLEPSCLSRLRSAAQTSPQLGALAPLLLDARDPRRIDGCGLELNLLGSGRDRRRGARVPCDLAPENVLAGTGGALFLRAQALRRCGLLDEGYGFYFEDLDLCLALRDAGYAIRTVPGARVRHAHSATLGLGSPRQAYFLARNPVRLVLKTFPWPHVAYAFPLSLARLALRLPTSVARGDLPQLAAHARALAWVLARVPSLARRRRPMRPATFALVTRRTRWPRGSEGASP